MRIEVPHIRVRPRENLHRRLALQGDTSNLGSLDAVEMIDELLNATRLPCHALAVDQVTFRAVLHSGAFGNRRSFSFDVNWPNGGSLYSQPEDLQPVGEQILRRWRIDTQPVAHADAWSEFLDLIDTGATVLGRTTVERWPQGLLGTLETEQILVKSEPARSAICMFCQESHDVEIDADEDGALKCRTFCPDLGRVVIFETSRVDQYEIQPAKLMELAAQPLGVRGQPDERVPGCVWRLGVSRYSGLVRPIYFATYGGFEHIGEAGWPFEEHAIVIVPSRPWHSPLLHCHDITFARLGSFLAYTEQGMIPDIDRFFDDVGIEPAKRDREAQPWFCTSDNEIVVYGQTYEVSLSRKEHRFLQIADGRTTVPLTELFQQNGQGAWKERLKHGHGTPAQRSRASTFMGRLSEKCADACVPLSFNLSRSNEIVVTIANHVPTDT